MIGTRKTVVVIGAGISGLCVAYFLKKSGINVVVLEQDSAPGGTMKTIADNGWLVEKGPNCTLETTPLFQQLCDDLGITDQRVYANDASNKRYIVRDGILHALPTNPVQFFSSKLWTLNAKLRLLKEPFTGRAAKEESVAEFSERRLGKELLDYAVNPFIAGVYAGDPEKLSARSAIPKVYALEEKYGSLIKGMILGKKAYTPRITKNKIRLFSFTKGMATLPNALAVHLESMLTLNATVENIIPMRAGRFPVYTVAYRHHEIRETVEASAVVISTPSYAAANIIRSIDPEMASTLNAIYYPPVAQVYIGFQQHQVSRPLDGFGFLVPEVEQRNILGSLWPSTIFPGRTPEGYVALTSFIGGARQPDLVSRTDEELLRLVMNDLKPLVGITGDAKYIKIIRCERAIPQYNLGYQKNLNAMDRLEQNFRGAFLCSNFRGGISVGDCVMSAEKVSEKVRQHLDQI